MLGNFTINLKPIKLSLSEQIQESLLDDLALKTHLNLFQHLAHKKIDLSKQYVFNSASEFHCVVAADEVCVFHLLARIVRYDVKKYSKVNKYYAQ